MSFATTTVSANLISFGYAVVAGATMTLEPATSRHAFAIKINAAGAGGVGVRFNNADSATNRILASGDYWEPVLPPGGRVYLENLDGVTTADILIITDTAREGTIPLFSSAEIGNIDASSLVVTLSAAVTSPTDDYETGFSVKVNAAPVTFTAPGNVGGTTVTLLLDAPVINTDVVLVSYNQSTGNLTSATNVPLFSFTDETVTNNVP